jgi:AraC-like DNA-binding protein
VFGSGDLFLFGGRLPHRFIRNPGLDRNGDTVSRAVVVQFRHDAFGAGFFQLPENTAIRHLLKKFEEGLVLHSGVPGTADILRQHSSVVSAAPARRLPALLNLLADLSEYEIEGRMSVLSPGAPDLRTHDTDAERISRLQDYIESEYARNSNIDEAAERLALTRTSFCRYVKRMTGRTFTELVNDYRLTVAAMMLRLPTPAVSTVSADAGFGSLSHFNSRFRERFETTPSEFRRLSCGSTSVTDKFC